MKDPKGGPYEFIEFENGFRITAENYGHTCFKKDDASHDDMILRWNALNAAWRYGRASRDGLRAELDRLIYVVCEKDVEIIEGILHEDDKIGEEVPK